MAAGADWLVGLERGPSLTRHWPRLGRVPLPNPWSKTLPGR